MDSGFTAQQRKPGNTSATQESLGELQEDTFAPGQGRSETERGPEGPTELKM